MRIADEIKLVAREFVHGATLVEALAKQEGVEVHQAASWLLRNIDSLNALTMYGFNQARLDFHFIDPPWSADPLQDAVVGDETPLWFDEPGDYLGGWIESDLRSFFSKTDVPYPEREIADLRGDLPIVCESAQSTNENLVSLSSRAGKEQESIGTKERTTLLTIIAALAEGAKISLITPSKSAELVAGMTERMGAPVAKRTIEEHLKKVPDALERKSR